jgi:hypothetical protein
MVLIHVQMDENYTVDQRMCLWRCILCSLSPQHHIALERGRRGGDHVLIQVQMDDIYVLENGPLEVHSHMRYREREREREKRRGPCIYPSADG